MWQRSRRASWTGLLSGMIGLLVLLGVPGPAVEGAEVGPPTVAVTASDALVTEAGLTRGAFRFTRTGSLTSALTVTYTVGGTATAGSDYVSLGTSVTFPAGRSTVTKTVTPLQDSLQEGSETITLTLTQSSLYAVGTARSATVTLTSDDLAVPTPVAPAGLLVTATPTYTRKPVAAAVEYALHVEDTIGVRLEEWFAASAVGCSGGTGMCSVHPEVELVAGAAAWAVKARSGGGESVWSSPRSFTVAPLEAPILLAPTGVISSMTPTYAWLVVLAAAEYGLMVEDGSGTRRELWISADQAGCVDADVCQLAPEWPLAAGGATWSVKARHAGGEGPSSRQRTFYVDPALNVRQWTAWAKWTEPAFLGNNGAGDPSAMRDGTLYRMAYTCSKPEDGEPMACLAESPDGIVWQNIPGQGGTEGLILQGRVNEWDVHVETSHLSKIGSRYLLYYSGYSEQGYPIPGFPGLLGLAQSIDGRTFKRVSSDPILRPTPGWHDNDAIFSPTVDVGEAIHHLLYTGHCYTACADEPGVRLLAATSSDGVYWTKRAEPVLTRSTEIAWMSEGAAEADLVHGPDRFYYLFFTGLQGEQRVIGVARGASPLGPWEINPVPIVIPTPGAFDAGGVLSPEVLIEGGKARMWYLSLTAEGYPWIGYAESVWPLLISPP